MYDCWRSLNQRGGSGRRSLVATCVLLVLPVRRSLSRGDFVEGAAFRFHPDVGVAGQHQGGPFADLYQEGDTEIGQAKRDPRLRKSGQLIGFCFEGLEFPLEPKTAFYDWLYCSFLWEHREWATSPYKYAGFTDVEFNPHRSINCQARSAALFLSLMKRGDLEHAIHSPDEFIQTLLLSRYRPHFASTTSRRKACSSRVDSAFDAQTDRSGWYKGFFPRWRQTLQALGGVA